MIKAQRKVPLATACIYCHTGKCRLVRTAYPTVNVSQLAMSINSALRALGSKSVPSHSHVECDGCKRRGRLAANACEAIKQWYKDRGSGLQRQSNEGSFDIPFNPGAMALAPLRESWVGSISPSAVT